ncbi:MAG: hypothetical protein AAGL69_16300 [Pseudomonadota bacterium]
MATWAVRSQCHVMNGTALYIADLIDRTVESDGKASLAKSKVRVKHLSSSELIKNHSGYEGCRSASSRLRRLKKQVWAAFCDVAVVTGALSTVAFQSQQPASDGTAQTIERREFMND